MTYIKNAKIVLENGILFDGVLAVEKDRIINVGTKAEISIPDTAQVIDADGAYVGPGFVDIHVHGGGDAMFFDNPEKAARHFLSHGETTILPTFYCTMNKEAFLQGIERVQKAKKEPIGKVLAGFYMEGPYLNPKHGADSKNNQWSGEIKQEDYKEVVDKAGQDVKVWVVAPERKGIDGFMEYAKSVNQAVCFAVGHSEASLSQINEVKKYGVHILTHCMNATGTVPTRRGTKACGPDEACFLSDEMYAELISDSLGIHVTPELQRLIVKIKGIDKIILISDSFVTDFESPESLRYTDLSFAENGDLCGSKLTMDVACRNFMKHTSYGIAQTFLAASRNPARVLGLDNEIGSIAIGKKANLVFVDDLFNVKKVMLEGEII